MQNRPTLGVLLLDTQFPRIPGDVGNPASYPFPVRLLTVPGATVQRAVYEADPSLLDQFIAAARQLEAAGVSAITSSCGFLSPLQESLARAVSVPVFISSLLQVPWVYQLTRKRVGIITASGASLTPAILEPAGITPAIPIAIAGLETSAAFRQPILENSATLDKAAVERDVVSTAQHMMAEHPELGSFVLECHNLAPYGHAVRQATGKPVFDVISFAEWVYLAIEKRVFPDPR